MAKRMFVAIDLPEHLAGALADLNPEIPGLRWLPATQLHLTLCFLGEVPAESERPLIAALGEIDAPGFPLALQGLGHFGRRSWPAVVWAGFENPPPELMRLQRHVQLAARSAGVAPDGKRFHPHVTVGRCKHLPEMALRPFLERHAATAFGSFEADGFTLYSSILRPEGAQHLPVFRQDAGV